MTENKRLTRARRIRSRKDFLRVQKHGKKVRSKHFLLAFSRRRADDTSQENSLQTDPRIGVTITTKVEKRAVRRNRLRRRVREIYRHHREHLQKKADLVVIALSGSAELEFSEVQSELLYCFKKAGLIIKEGSR